MSAILIPNGDGTNNNVIIGAGTGQLYEQIDEDLASPDDVSTMLSFLQSTDCFFMLSGVPADYGETSGVTIGLRVRTNKSTTCRLYAQLFESNETTPITDEVEFINPGGTGIFKTVSNMMTVTGSTARISMSFARLRIRCSSGSGFFNVSAAQVVASYLPLLTDPSPFFLFLEDQ